MLTCKRARDRRDLAILGLTDGNSALKTTLCHILPPWGRRIINSTFVWDENVVSVLTLVINLCNMPRPPETPTLQQLLPHSR